MLQHSLLKQQRQRQHERLSQDVEQSDTALLPLLPSNVRILNEHG